MLRRFLAAFNSVPGCVILGSLAFLLYCGLASRWEALAGVLVVGLGMLVILAALIGDSTLEIRIDELQDQTVDVDGGCMRAIDEEGQVVATIDLSAPFRVTIPYVGNGKGVYRVEQDGQRLEFSSTMDGAEHLAKDVLGLKSWPPDADITW